MRQQPHGQAEIQTDGGIVGIGEGGSKDMVEQRPMPNNPNRFDERQIGHDWKNPETSTLWLARLLIGKNSH